MRHDGAVGHAPLPDSGFLEDWAARLRQAAERPVVGILLRGSHARRAATAHSDVDLDVLVGGTPYAVRRAYLTETAGQVTHVSVAARDVRSWVHRLGEPADWAFGLPVTAPARLLWADPHWRPRIDLPVLCQPAEPPRLEEMIATLGKAAAARAANDRLGVRLAVADLARLCPSVLRPANPSVRVHSRRTAFAAALDLPVTPPGYRADMLLCLGLRPGATGQLWAAAVRLVAGTLPLIRPYAEEIAETAGADLAAALVDGRLDRYVAQLARPAGPAPRPHPSGLPQPHPSGPGPQPWRERSAAPAPRAGELVTVPVPDPPVTGVPSDPNELAAPAPGASLPARPGHRRPAAPHRRRSGRRRGARARLR